MIRSTSMAIALLTITTICVHAHTSEALPDYLRFADNQCPPWTMPDQPKQDFLTDSSSPMSPPYRYIGGDNPYRLTNIATVLVGSERYAIPAGYIHGILGDDSYEDAIRGEGLEAVWFPAFGFWMPSLRPVERYMYGGLLRFCEPGRALPGPDDYVISVQVNPAGTAGAGDIRAERLKWLEQTELLLGVSLTEVISRNSEDYISRISEDIPGAIVFDGLNLANAPDIYEPPFDPLKQITYLVNLDGLFGRFRCIAVVVTQDRNLAPYQVCEAFLGPSDIGSALPEASFSIPRNRLFEWQKVYTEIVYLLDSWRISGD